MTAQSPDAAGRAVDAVAPVGEFELVDLLRARCATGREDVRVGIGDDAALLAVPAGQLLAVSTDTLVSGVHFAADAAAADIGWKALAVNLSDLAAMGATPAWACLALTLPRADARWLGEFADGFCAVAREYRLALVGGDTTAGPLSITVTIHGFVPPGTALLRSAARAGDGVFVTGTLGDAAAALALSGGGRGASDAIADGVTGYPGARDPATRAALLARLHRPVARVAQGRILRGRAHACIDVSDGLAADLAHVCAASGVGAEVDADTLPASPALLACGGAALRRAWQLAGGDDYELCFTAADVEADALLGDLARSGCAATRIGRVVSTPGVRVFDGAGAALALPRRGWNHFA